MVNHRKSWAGNVFVWLDLTLDPGPNTGPPPWQRLGTCLMSHDLCLTDWMVCLRIR